MAAGDGAPLRSWEKAPRPLPSRSWLELQVRLSPAKSSFPRGDSPRPVRSGLRPPPSSLANLYRDETRAGFPYSFRGFAEVGCNTRRAGSAERAALSGGLLYCRPLASSSLRPSERRPWKAYRGSPRDRCDGPRDVLLEDPPHHRSPGDRRPARRSPAGPPPCRARAGAGVRGGGGLLNAPTRPPGEPPPDRLWGRRGESQHHVGHANTPAQHVSQDFSPHVSHASSEGFRPRSVPYATSPRSR